MPSRKLTRLLTTPLARPLVPSVEYRASASANLYETLFASLGATGNVTDGIAGTWQQSEGGAAANDGDPCGYTSDQSGGSTPLTQTTGANKPTVTVTNGIPALTAGNNKEIGADITYSGVSELSWIGVCYGPNNTTPLEWFGFHGGTVDFLQFHDPADRLQFYYDAAQKSYLSVPSLRGGPRILRLVYESSAYNLYVYDMTGALVTSTSGAMPATANFDGPYTLFWNLSPQGAGQIAFALLADKAITGDNWSAVLADLVDRYGGWHA